ncbi:MAG: hypothetical protein ACRCUY_13445 [Thermoguttaceae bacterium]
MTHSTFCDTIVVQNNTNIVNPDVVPLFNTAKSIKQHYYPCYFLGKLLIFAKQVLSGILAKVGNKQAEKPDLPSQFSDL